MSQRSRAPCRKGHVHRPGARAGRRARRAGGRRVRRPAATAGTAAGAAALVVDRRRTGPVPQRREASSATLRRIGAGEFPVRVILSLPPTDCPSGTAFQFPGNWKVPGERETGQVTTSFELTDRQRDLRVKARAFARDVLREAKATGAPASAEERFLATKPAYQRSSRRASAGLHPDGRRRGQREPHRHRGGDGGAVLREPQRGLDVAGHGVGFSAGAGGRSPANASNCWRRPLTSGAPLAAFCSSEPGGSANAGARHPARACAPATARTGSGDQWPQEVGVLGDRLAARRRRPAVRGVPHDPEAPAERGISIIAVEKPTSGVVLDRVIESPGYRSHLLPEFSFHDVVAPEENLLGEEGGGLRLAGASFTGAAGCGAGESAACDRRPRASTPPPACRSRRGAGEARPGQPQPATLLAEQFSSARRHRGRRTRAAGASVPGDSMTRSSTTPEVGFSTAMMEIPRSAGASGSVRHTTHSRSAPSRCQPSPRTPLLAAIDHPLPVSRGWPGCARPRRVAGAPAFALPPGSLEQNAASGAPLVERNGANNCLRWPGLPPTARLKTQHRGQQRQGHAGVSRSTAPPSPPRCR